MNDFLIYLNGILATLVLAQLWLITSNAKSAKLELLQTLKDIQESHNLITSNQMSVDQRLNDMGIVVVGIEQKMSLRR